MPDPSKQLEISAFSGRCWIVFIHSLVLMNHLWRVCHERLYKLFVQKQNFCGCVLKFNNYKPFGLDVLFVYCPWFHFSKMKGTSLLRRPITYCHQSNGVKTRLLGRGRGIHTGCFVSLYVWSHYPPPLKAQHLQGPTSSLTHYLVFGSDIITSFSSMYDFTIHPLGGPTSSPNIFTGTLLGVWLWYRRYCPLWLVTYRRPISRF